MSEREQLEDILYDFFAGVLADIGYENIQLIYEGENGVRPVPPFLSLAFNNITMLGTTAYFKPGMEEIAENKYFETSVQPIERNMTLRGFGASTEDILNQIHSLLQFDTYINKLIKNHIVIKDIENVNEGSTNYSEEEETFYFMDFVVTYNRKTQIENEYIGGVEISSEGLQKPNEETTNPINIEIQEE